MILGAFHASGNSELVVVAGMVNQQHYITFTELGQISKEIFGLYMAMAHPILHEIHANF